MRSYKFDNEFKKREKVIRPFKQYCCGAKEFVFWVIFLAMLVSIGYYVIYGIRISLSDEIINEYRGS